MHEKCRLLLCLFSLSPPEEKTRRQLRELRGAERAEGGLCRAGRGGEGGGGQAEGWNRVQEPSGVQQACIGECCGCAHTLNETQLHTVLTDAVQDIAQGCFFYTTDCCSSKHFPIIFMYTCLIALKSPLVDVETLFRQ